MMIRGVTPEPLVSGGPGNNGFLQEKCNLIMILSKVFGIRLKNDI